MISNIWECESDVVSTPVDSNIEMIFNEVLLVKGKIYFFKNLMSEAESEIYETT